MQNRARVIMPSLLVLSCFLPIVAAAREAIAEPGGDRTVILDTTGFWRIWHTLKPPVMKFDDGLTAIPINRGKWLDCPTPEPPADWRQVEFDDGAWLRGPGRIACRTPYLARLCMRGRFGVTDPAAVKGLRFSLDYRGGAIVYLNGTEIARGHVASSEADNPAPATGYPREAYVTPKDELLIAWKQLGPWWSKDPVLDPAIRQRIDLRTRRLAGVVVPRELLRKGVNVLAIEIVRSPYHKVLEEKKLEKVGARSIGCAYDLSFNTCEFVLAQLTADDSAGIVPNTVRPSGLQVWNSGLLTWDYDLDFAGRSEPLRPIRIVGARNGTFSGKVVIGSTSPIRKLKVLPGVLTNGSVNIPASAVRVRYAVPGGIQYGDYGYTWGILDNEHSRYPREPELLGHLAEAPLEEFPVRRKKAQRLDLKTLNQPEPVFGAVVPIWLTVKVPADAQAGAYRGRVTIRVEGEQPVTVPIELRVADWTVPDTQDYRTWVGMIQSPDTLALEYDVPLWSDEHFRLIAKSFDHIGDTGSRILYIPLICHTNFGNAESMVRWIEKGDNRYSYDFSVLERYLDTAEKHMGRPKRVVLWVWDIYLIQKDKMRPTSSHDQEGRAFRHLNKLGAKLGTGPLVTVLDPRTGQSDSVYLPRFDHPSARGLWQPLLRELRNRLKRRGLEDSLLLGMMSDAWPTRQEAEFFKEISGGLPWASHSHMGVASAMLHDISPVGYQVRVWNVGFANDDPPAGSHYGWQKPTFIAEHVRHRQLHWYPAARVRHQAELNITGHQRGIARIGADYWSVIKDKYGVRQGVVASRYPESSWRNLDLMSSFLVPGPDGPIATARHEIFREGIQECEARIVIERALGDEKLRKKLGPELAGHCQEFLIHRTRFILKGGTDLQLSGHLFNYVTQTMSGMYWIRRPPVTGGRWYAGSGWQERSEKLYALAGEVRRKLGE